MGISVDYFHIICENRKKKFIDMAKEGYSEYDIARYFEVRPKYVAKLIKDVQSLESPKVDIDILLLQRDEKLKSLEKDDLTKEGFYFLPQNNVLAQSEVTPYEPESNDINYLFAFQMNNAISFINQKKMKRLMPDFDFGKVSERGEQYRQGLLKSKITELLASGFQNKDIIKYLNLTYYESTDMINALKKSYHLESYPDVEKTKTLLLKGFKAADIADYFGAHPISITEIKKEIPQSANLAYRREQVYALYQQGKTQTQIAKLLELNRVTVNSDIQQYKKENNLKRERITWRDGSFRPLNEKLKKEAIQLRLAGVKTSEIVHLLSVREGSLQRFFEVEEHTEGTALYENKKKYEAAIEKGLAEGKSASEIAKEIGKSYQFVNSHIRKMNESKKGSP